MTTLTSQAQHVTGRPSRGRWFLALGVALLLLGLAGAGATTLLELSSLMIFGPLLLVGSFLQILIAFLVDKGKDRFLHIAAAGVEGALGFYIMANPLVAFVDLVTLIGAALVLSGVLRLVRSLREHSPARHWALVAAGGAVLLGVCAWLKLPVSELWFVGLCLALDFVCHGVTWATKGLAEGKELAEAAQ